MTMSNWLKDGAKDRFDLVEKADLDTANEKVAELEKELSAQNEPAESTEESVKLLASAETVDGTTVYFDGPDGTAITAGTILYTEDPTDNPEAPLVPDATHEFADLSVVTVAGEVTEVVEGEETEEEEVEAQVDEPITPEDAAEGLGTVTIEQIVAALTPVIDAAVAAALGSNQENLKAMSEEGGIIHGLQEQVKSLAAEPAGNKTTFGKNPSASGRGTMQERMGSYSIPKTLND